MVSQIVIDNNLFISGFTKKVGLKAARKIEFFNGKLDCRLMEYELYNGSKREMGERPKFKDRLG